MFHWCHDYDEDSVMDMMVINSLALILPNSVKLFDVNKVIWRRILSHPVNEIMWT